MWRSFLLGLVLFSLTVISHAQPRELAASEIQLELEKLGIVGNALYLAAHPDDENTRLIAWLANEQKVRTAYLSLTRGDGGQNLIGDEKGPLMGLIRTQELVEARKLDRGEQFFTRALDFGYSKTAQETFEKWDRDSVLADVVWVIRQFKPDIIVTRFPPNEYAGHGHHTASAMLANDAFEAAGDATRFPESAKLFGTWQPERLYFNQSSWWNPDISDEADKFALANIGQYNQLLGEAYGVMAAKSRSQHRSQGFGARLDRGRKIEYLEPKLGTATAEGLFAGIDISWDRIQGGKEIGKQIQAIQEAFDPKDPAASVAALVNLYFELQKLPENPWKDYKLQQTRNLIAACGGLWMECLADRPLVVGGESLEARVEAVSQTGYSFTLNKIILNKQAYTIDQTIKDERYSWSHSITASDEVTHPYWLAEAPQNDLFSVTDRSLIGRPENPAIYAAQLVFAFDQGEIAFERPMLYKWVDRADGELYRPVAIVPEVTVTPLQNTLVFTNDSPKEITLKCETRDRSVSGWVLEPIVPEGWRCEPRSFKQEKLDAQTAVFARFTLYPPARLDRQPLRFQMQSAGNPSGTVAHDLREISYPHIQTQVVMPLTEVNLVSAPLQVTGNQIGYIPGAGDEVAASLEQIGYTVTEIDPQRATLEELKAYDAVVTGIRAFNTQKSLSTFSAVLQQYAYEGGHVVIQYNTNRGLVTDNLVPGELELSRKRVTKEEAAVTFVNAEHPVLTTPNQLNKADFENWVQERGLYFASSWDDAFQPIISWHDPDEDPQQGSLLVRDYGKGSYIFTGISFFRQLPAGVPGAYRLWANLLSYRPGSYAKPTDKP